MDSSTSPYLTASTAASGRYEHGSAVPERFRGTSSPVPGHSVVPAEFQGTSNPDVAKTTFIDVTPAEGKHTADRESDAEPPSGNES